MAYPPRKLAFILAPTDQGTLIVNRFDYRIINESQGFGVGYMLLNFGSYEGSEVAMAATLLTLRKQYFGPGVVALDCGANIGVFSVEWAKLMHGWGHVIAIEAQERIFYALAGNIAINNCFNARAILAAVGNQSGVLRIPVPDYLSPGTFGSVELKQSPRNEFIGQTLSYAEENLQPVKAITIDALNLSRLDLLKIDVEGMEQEVLDGARASIGQHRPIIIVERIKSDQAALTAQLEAHGYRCFESGLNILAVHAGDPALSHIQIAGRKE
jgi:FkbM family methyltransferase